MSELKISYKIVCDSCKEGLDFEIVFPDNLHGMEEISIKHRINTCFTTQSTCNCQNEQLKILKQTIADIKQAMKFIK